MLRAPGNRSRKVEDTDGGYLSGCERGMEEVEDERCQQRLGNGQWVVRQWWRGFGQSTAVTPRAQRTTSTVVSTQASEGWRHLAKQ